jgi:hypothetical protein
MADWLSSLPNHLPGPRERIQPSKANAYIKPPVANEVSSPLFGGFRIEDDRFQSRLRTHFENRTDEMMGMRGRDISGGDLGLRIVNGIEGFRDWMVQLSPDRRI